MAYSTDADPRFKDTPDRARAESHASDNKKRPRIAFTGEEYGFGYQATQRLLERARQKRTIHDGGLRALSARTEREYDEASKNSQFNYQAEIPQPLRTKEQALMAVKSNTADFAIVPFYSPYAGYDFETLRAMSSLFTTLGVEQIEATDNLCLAVHESQLYDQIQSSHPGTGFSALQRRVRKTWGPVDPSGESRLDSAEGELPRAGLPIDMADQKLIRDRIDMVFAGPEAARRCKSKLDGLRAIGVEVQETPQMVEPHRELAKRARATLNPNRQTNTFFDPRDGKTHFISTLGAETQTNQLFGMVLPYEVAMRSTDYVIIDHNMDDGPANKTRFMVVENNPDHSLFEDKYRTTDARTAYWGRRINAIANSSGTFGAGLMKFAGMTVGVLAVALIMLGVYGVSEIAWPALANAPALSWVSSLTTTGALGLGAIAAFAAWTMLSVQSRGEQGVRVMMRFRRDQTAASIGDIENYLRNYGVRHTVVRMDEDSEGSAPAGIILDIEFDPEDFSYGPFAMLSRRLRGSVVNGALKKAFQRWKNRGVVVLAAMPFEARQLPNHKARRWWSEALGDWAADFTETMFIRFSRILFFYALPVLLLWFFVWKGLLGG